jgi:hypothetical protein
MVENFWTRVEFKRRFRNEYHSFPLHILLTFSVDQLHVKDFCIWLTVKISHAPNLGGTQFILLYLSMLKAIKHCKSRVCCKYHLHRYKKSSWRATTTTTAYPCDVHHRCIVDFLWWDIALSTVLLCTTNRHSGLYKKTNLVYCRVASNSMNPSVGCKCRYQCTKPRERHDNNHKLVDCCVPFCIRWRSSSPVSIVIVRSHEHHADRSCRSIDSIEQVSSLAIVVPVRSRDRAIKHPSRASRA